MEVGTAGSTTSTQGYEPNGPELELVHAQCIAIHTPGGRHDPPRDAVAMGRDSMSPRLHLKIAEQFQRVLGGHE
eukprot:10913926-Prorocentrum_lima.AAC.1